MLNKLGRSFACQSLSFSPNSAIILPAYPLPLYSGGQKTLATPCATTSLTSPSAATRARFLIDSQPHKTFLSFSLVPAGWCTKTQDVRPPFSVKACWTRSSSRRKYAGTDSRPRHSSLLAWSCACCSEAVAKTRWSSGESRAGREAMAQGGIFLGMGMHVCSTCVIRSRIRMNNLDAIMRKQKLEGFLRRRPR